jgi:hypothetical protein
MTSLVILHEHFLSDLGLYHVCLLLDARRPDCVWRHFDWRVSLEGGLPGREK